MPNLDISVDVIAALVQQIAFCIYALSSLSSYATHKCNPANMASPEKTLYPETRWQVLYNSLCAIQALEENAARGVAGLPQTPALLWQLIRAVEYLHSHQVRTLQNCSCGYERMTLGLQCQQSNVQLLLTLLPCAVGSSGELAIISPDVQILIVCAMPSRVCFLYQR